MQTLERMLKQSDWRAKGAAVEKLRVHRK